jgi:CheY-like chemotaxis protein
MVEKCILQVEDEEADIFLLRHVFERAGITCPVRAVTDGQMALDYLTGAGKFADRRQYPLPCLVLLDLNLPKRAGLEVLAWIRAHPQFNHLVVVLFSSSALPEDLKRAYALGANSYIEKPSGMERTLELAQLLKGWWLGVNRYAPIDTVPQAPGASALPAGSNT